MMSRGACRGESRSPAGRESGSSGSRGGGYLRRLTIVLCLLFPVPCFSVLPPELPGEELTQEQFDSAVRRGETARAAPAASAEGAQPRAPQFPALQFGDAMQTWNAPPLAVQMSVDATIIPFGKGGFFVPRYTETNSEPDVEIFDLNDSLVGTMKTGSAFTLLPGRYDVMLGSGSKQQRIVKRVTVEEGRMSTIEPDWSGLAIEVVDERGVALKGEYELVRIDEFDPYGRGYGASVELGETVKAWILKPGIYKILGAGAGYSTMTNFVTVKLLPGEFTNFLLIQEPEKFNIRGGGTLYMAPTTKLMSNWQIGANIGANMMFNAESDHESNIDMNSLTIGLLADTWILYRKKPVEWSTRLRLDESINITDNDPDQMLNSPDRLVMSSIFIWRILNWFGPYTRAEFNTKFFTTRVKRVKEERFSFVDPDYALDEARGFDTSLVFPIEPSFSPLIFEVGAGVNADLTSRRYFEARVRAGLGSSYSRYDDRYRVIETGKVKYRSDDSLEQKALVATSIALYHENRVNIFEVGPQTSLSAMVRIGGFASAEGEVKLFAPVVPEPRLNNPDFDINTTLSWRLSSILNLDYTYRQSLRRPAELDVPIHTSSHGIWLRLHFSSR